MGRIGHVVVVLVCALVWACMAGAEPAQVLDRAQVAFEHGMELRQTDPDAARVAFDEVIAAYETLASEHDIVNGGALYNMGNAYLLSGRVGRAIAAYRQALALRPGDADVQANLGVARSRVVGRIEVPAGSAVAQAMLAWHRWPGEHRVLLFLVANALLWIGIAARLLVGGRMPRWPAVLGGAVALIMGASIGAQLRQGERLGGVVVETALMGRQGPGGDGQYAPSFTRALSPGIEFRVVEDRGRWLLAALGDGRETWLPRDRVALFAIN